MSIQKTNLDSSSPVDPDTRVDPEIQEKGRASPITVSNEEGQKDDRQSPHRQSRISGGRSDSDTGSIRQVSYCHTREETPVVLFRERGHPILPQYILYFIRVLTERAV